MSGVLIIPVQVPYPMPMKRQQFLAIRWLIHASRDRKGLGMHNKLAAEIMDAYNNQVCTHACIL